MSNNDNSLALEIAIIGLNDDLGRIVDDINRASWDDANEMTSYDVASFQTYLKCQDTVFVTCYDVSSTARTLLGFASGRFQLKPYDNEKWLYVDELDVCANQRKKGAGTAMMLKLIELAGNAGCDEVWLGTEVDNIPANALYRSLNPAEVETFVGYTYHLDG